jgi:dUTP pyrophosphatase
MILMQIDEGAAVPAYASAAASGLDLSSIERVELLPGQWRLIKTGVRIALPAGLEAQIRPRSGLALKHGITVLNAPGTIDADYRGEIMVLLINHGKEPYVVEPGARIAQMVITSVVRWSFDIVDVLPPTERGAGGFGSTG